MEVLILIVPAFFACIFIAVIIRPVVYFFNPIFMGLNWILWFLQNPLRFSQKKLHTGVSRGLFLIFSYTGVYLVWFVMMYFLTLPIRVVLALYYDVMLYISVSLADSIQELVHPKAKGFRNMRGGKYFFRYIWTFPFRFVSFLVRGSTYVLDSFLMLGVSIAFPTLTMRHGTKFEGAASKASQSKKWLVGNGNYAGTGVYFGLSDATAQHYAKQATGGGDTSVMLVRMTLSFCKNLSTLSKEKRIVGTGDIGEQLTKNISPLYQTIEHYRTDFGGWWEYCLLRKGMREKFTSSWRIRPVAVIRENKITRLYGGFGHYSVGTGLIAGAISWAWLFFLFGSLAT